MAHIHLMDHGLTLTVAPVDVTFCERCESYHVRLPDNRAILANLAADLAELVTEGIPPEDAPTAAAALLSLAEVGPLGCLQSIRFGLGFLRMAQQRALSPEEEETPDA